MGGTKWIDDTNGQIVSTTMLSPEMRLVAACCRWPATAARDALIRSAAQGVDWDLVARLMVRHRVIGVVHSALLTTGVAVPAAILSTMAKQSARIAARNNVMALESARLQAAMDAAGIPSLLVKGAPLALLAYGTLDAKHAKDIDLLVRPEDLLRAIDLVQPDGYVLQIPAGPLNAQQWRDVMRYSRDVALFDRARRVQLELHWGLADNPRMLPELRADTPGQMVQLGPGGNAVRTLAPDDLFAYLCVHGAAHGWIRLKWLADLASLLSTASLEEIERLYRAAAARRVGDCAAQALLLAEALLGVPLPPALATELRGARHVRRLVDAALDIMAGPGAEVEIAERRFGQARLIRARLMLSRDWRDLAVNLFAHMTALEDVLAVRLPPRLHLLYPLLRIPLWIGRRVDRRRAKTQERR